MDKNAIRKEMRQRRSQVTSRERHSASKAICTTLLESNKIDLLSTCWKICPYLSAAREISTRTIITEFWNAMREVCVPVWNSELKSYDLSFFTPGSKLIKGPLGIKEPLERYPVPVWEVDAFIIPGLAFDMYGGRLGFGAGFYDRILANRRKDTKLIALCYDWQLMTDAVIPQESHDVRVQWIVTEKQIIKCGEPPRRRSETTNL
jgi:5-formyltetrahydrofolate cyclo-ligase